MSRESIVQLINRKQELHAEQFDAESKAKVIYDEHLWVADEDPFGASTDDSQKLTPKELELQTAYLAFRNDELLAKLRINRAHLFGLRYAKTPHPSICMACFVDHGESSQMSEIKSTFGHGFRQFKCVKCGVELRIAPAP